MKSHPDNRFLLLPLQFDVERLVEDVLLCEAEQWKAHYNQMDFEGDWTGIALRSPTGQSTDLVAFSPDEFNDTPALAKCTYFREILSGLNCPVESVRLLALSPGSVIRTHRDMGLGYPHGRFRLHIPVLTDPDVDFIVDDNLLHMEPGQCWYADFSLPHSVVHHGRQRRIHLVIDGVRNAWTDELFKNAGYQFEREQTGQPPDAHAKQEMILHLERMNTETARNIIASLRSDDPDPALSASGHTAEAAGDLAHGWIPTSLSIADNKLTFGWQYIGDDPFTQPFFHETLRKTKRHPINARHSGRKTSLETFQDVSMQVESVTPTAIIFHVSRCGSTWLTQSLCTDVKHIVVSEPPLLDAILRIPFQGYSIDQESLDTALTSAVRILGRQKNPEENQFFIKTDSWHILLMDQWRRLYPDTPFIILYRHPEEIILSHQKQPGLQSIPYFLEPALTGIPFDPELVSNPPLYLIKYLFQIYSRLVQIQKEDPLCWLISYEEGLTSMLHTIEAATGLTFGADAIRRMEERAQYHAKKPHERFVAEEKSASSMSLPQALLNNYACLQSGRSGRVVSS